MRGPEDPGLSLNSATSGEFLPVAGLRVPVWTMWMAQSCPHRVRPGADPPDTSASFLPRWDQGLCWRRVGVRRQPQPWPAAVPTLQRGVAGFPGLKWVSLVFSDSLSPEFSFSGHLKIPFTHPVECSACWASWRVLGDRVGNTRPPVTPLVLMAGTGEGRNQQ